jgi:hypothetical protein
MYCELEGPAYDGKEAQTAKQKSKYLKTVVYSALRTHYRSTEAKKWEGLVTISKIFWTSIKPLYIKWAVPCHFVICFQPLSLSPIMGS